MTANRRLFLASFGSEFAFTMALFALAPLILWLFGAEAIGAYGKFQGSVAVCAVFATLRLELTVGSTPLAYRRVLAVTSLYGPLLTLMAATTITLFTAGDSPWINAASQLVMMALAAWLIGYVNVFNFHFVAVAAKKYLVLSKLARIGTLVILQLPLAYLLSIDSYLYLAFSFVLSLVAFNLVAVSAVKPVAPSMAGLGMAWRWLKRHRSLIAANVPAALFVAVQELLLISLIAVQSPYLAGIYFVADRLLKTPMTMLNQTLRQFILTGRVTDSARLSRVVFGGALVVTTVALLGASVITAVVVSFIAGEFIDVIRCAALLTIFYAASAFASILISALVKQGLNRYVFFYSLGLLILTAVSGGLAQVVAVDVLKIFVVLATTFCFVMGGYLYLRVTNKVVW